jgi:hypothetical protein
VQKYQGSFEAQNSALKKPVGPENPKHLSIQAIYFDSVGERAKKFAALYYILLEAKTVNYI